MKSAIDAVALDRELQQLRNVRVTRADVDAVLAKLGPLIGMDSLALDAQGTADLIFDQRLPLSLVYLEHLPGVVAAVPLTGVDEDDPATLVRLLQANMDWAQTQGGSFGLLPGRSEPMLLRLLPLKTSATSATSENADAARLHRDLTAFVQLAATWQAQLAQRDDAQAASPDAPPPPGGIRV